MKKLFLCIAAVSCSILASAQVKGDQYISGTGSLSFGSQSTILIDGGLSEKVSQPTASVYGLGVEYAYFISDNLRLAIASRFSIASNPVEEIGSSWSKQTTFVVSLNPNVAYYVKIAENFYYTPELGLSVGFGSVTTPLEANLSYTTPVSNINAYVNLLTFEHRISQHFSMGYGIGAAYLNSSIYKDPDDKSNSAKVNTLKFDLGTAGIHARYYF